MNKELIRLRKEATNINKRLMDFLSKKISKNGFDLHEYYGKTTTAAAFSLSNSYLDKIPPLIKAYEKDNQTEINSHQEFNNMALQNVKLEHYKEIKNVYYPLKYNIPFFRKVTNWMLLRALTYLKVKNLVSYVKGNLIIMLVLLGQQRKGILYDNRLYRFKELSHQYHAFATSLLGEIYLETGNSFYLKKFKKAINYLKKISSSSEKFNKKRTRGYKQIFGYASGIHALILGYIILKDDECLKNAVVLFNYLKKYQRKDGSFPLVLSKEEYNVKTYKNGEKLPYWESYNRLYDYLGFLALYLAKIVKIIEEEI